MCFGPSEQASFDEGKKESEVSFQASESLREDNLSHHNTVVHSREISVGDFSGRLASQKKKVPGASRLRCTATGCAQPQRVVNISGGDSEVPRLSPPVGDMG